MADPLDEDDLFKHTSMTFGEHLEELRASLLKAVLALAVGFGIGLIVAPWVVQLIQSPLETALTEYYSDEAVEYVNARVPPELRDDPSVEKLVFDEGLVPKEVYIAPSDVLRSLRQKFPKEFTGVELPRDGTAAPAATGTSAQPTTPGATPSAATAPQPAASNDDGSLEPNLTKGDLLRLFMWTRLADDERIRLKVMNVQESFFIYIKAAFLFGALIASPAVFWFLWSFVAAGLYPHEKKYVHTFLPVSVGLFLSGALLAFTLVFPPVLGFFFRVTKSMGQVMEPRISEWLSFVLLLPLGFGVSFQLPLVMLFLERIHVFSVETYISKWRLAVLLMAIIAMVLSPGGDPNSMVMMLVPLICLYFGGIALCRWLPSGRGGVPAVVKTPVAGD